MGVRLLWILALAAAAAAMAVACNGGGSDSPASPSPSSTTPATGTSTATTAASPSPSSSPTPGGLTYTVQPGDTLSSIAREFGTTVAALANLNHIEDVDNIAVGAVLRIPAAGTPSATATATPGRTATPSATPSTSGPSALIRSGERSSNLVALTFDMGGRLEPAVQIMEFLVANQVRATIFPTGASLENPNSSLGREAFAILVAHPELFDVGSHSYSHPDFTTLSAAEIADELARTEAAIAGLGGPSPRPFFRPPFGAVGEAVLEAAGDAGYAYTVMWDVDTIDWRPESDGGPTAAEIAAKVLENAQGGSIVLMHLGGYNTLAALPEIVRGLRDRGFELATVAEVLE
jgi:peptidoglycan/xylan/chitin deacetylase (PgdA/CDA1 family)